MELRPIFILGPHKAGTSLLRNLFDGHSQLFVSPIETHFFRFLGHWVDYDLKRRFPEHFERSSLIGAFTTLVRRLNEQENLLGDSSLKGCFDVKKFQDRFETLSVAPDDREVIQQYFQALHYSLHNEELTTSRVLHKTVGLGEHALELKQLFPKARFVHIVRNPYANLVAFRKFRTSKGTYPLIDRLIRSLSNNYYFLYKNQKLLDDYHVIRYEDLVTDPRSHMESLADKLGLPFEDVLMSPTSMGVSWSGNSSAGSELEGVDPKVLGKWKKELHPMEKHYVGHFFPHILRDHAYEHLGEVSRSAFLKPAKKEGVKRYLYNRIFHLYARNVRSLRKSSYE